MKQEPSQMMMMICHLLAASVTMRMRSRQDKWRKSRRGLVFLYKENHALHLVLVIESFTHTARASTGSGERNGVFTLVRGVVH